MESVNVVQCGGTQLGLVLASCPACGIALKERGVADGTESIIENEREKKTTRQQFHQLVAAIDKQKALLSCLYSGCNCCVESLPFQEYVLRAGSSTCARVSALPHDSRPCQTSQLSQTFANDRRPLTLQPHDTKPYLPSLTISTTSTTAVHPAHSPLSPTLCKCAAQR
jgi:hypothetical protein